MDINNVFIIIGKGWSKRRVIKDLKGEGYRHNFYFSNGTVGNNEIKQLGISEEVWLFGDCNGLEILKYVERNQLDVWKMG